MKKVFLSLIAIALLASCNNETKQAETSNETVSVDGTTGAGISEVDASEAAVFKFEQDTYDFGQIKEGEKVSYSFTFVNTGKVPMIINSATATCGCTVPDYPREPIAPNAEGKISVVFDSKGKPGMQNKVITVTANTVPRTTELHLIGDVKAAAINN